MKRSRSAFIVIGVILLVAAAWLAFARGSVNRRVTALEQNPAGIPASIQPLRFTMLAQSDTVISARVTFLDCRGKEVRTIERSWNGNRLVFEFVRLKVGGRYLQFPARISSGGTGPGLPLFQYYDRSGFPLIYRGDDMDGRTERELSAAFTAVRTPWFLDAARSRLSMTTQTFGTFEHNAIYAVTCTADGRIIIEKY